ncbi:MAG: bifunctional 2-polyprenyl-6-hydroxyphenol methylase/3-demethylubiquinol 3-O-methyltransferase UbiG, partial [Magnetococcales bacterium]|nr:bifunctional 2-polyprenyl-6-hydroxyphenol methylase/3-demethylubiquinol 3-O-methyltransferase UbiG [Magnetococcales bacterium]
DLSGLNILDIGCGGGILSESLAEEGANVVAIDRSEKIIGVAKTHQQESGSSVDYRVQSAKDLTAEAPGSFDAVVAMEVLEHVADVPTFLGECAQLVKPGGHFFFATLNRTPKSWLFAIVGAEYILGWLPRGTHEYHKFIRPSDLRRDLRHVGISVKSIAGMSYVPLENDWTLSRDTSVNYLGVGILDPGRS